LKDLTELQLETTTTFASGAFPAFLDARGRRRSGSIDNVDVTPWRDGCGRVSRAALVHGENERVELRWE
jgi:hypothetical protein